MWPFPARKIDRSQPSGFDSKADIQVILSPDTKLTQCLGSSVGDRNASYSIYKEKLKSKEMDESVFQSAMSSLWSLLINELPGRPMRLFAVQCITVHN